MKRVNLMDKTLECGKELKENKAYESNEME